MNKCTPKTFDTKNRCCFQVSIDVDMCLWFSHFEWLHTVNRNAKSERMSAHYNYVCVSSLRRSKGWQTSWRTLVCAWRTRWTSTGKWWTNWDRTDTSSRKKRMPCRRWEGLFYAIRHMHRVGCLFCCSLCFLSFTLLSLTAIMLAHTPTKYCTAII